MKLKSLFIILTIALAFTGCKKSPEEAIKYNDAIVNEQIKMVTAIKELQNTYENFVPEKMLAAQKKAQEVIKVGIKKTQDMPDFEDDGSLKIAALKLFGVYQNVVNNEHTEMIRLYMLPENKYGDAELKKWEGLYKQLLENMTNSLAEFEKTQKEFATKHEFPISINQQH